MTHFMRLIRGVVLRGASLGDLSREILVLAIFILLAMSFAILRFKKRLD
jgi:ABC-2 type transport system permease protein